MNCFKQLVTSGFLANARIEIELANVADTVKKHNPLSKSKEKSDNMASLRQIVSDSYFSEHLDDYYFDKSSRTYSQSRAMFYSAFVKKFNILGVLEEAIEKITKDGLDPSLIYYIKVSHYSFIYSQSKKQIEQAIDYKYNVWGEYPFYTAKHVINNYTFYAVLTDSRRCFAPMSPN